MKPVVKKDLFSMIRKVLDVGNCKMNSEENHAAFQHYAREERK